MHNLRAAIAPVIALLAWTTANAHAAGNQVVNIALRDSSSDAALAQMQMKADPAKVKAGRVTFDAVNQSRDLVHEVLVVPAPAAGKELPYDAKSNEINEKRAHAKGEISDLKPGAHGSLTLVLQPGTYWLVCNQPGHYKSGMYAKLTVEK